MVTFLNIDGSPATDVSYWHGCNPDKWPWACSTLKPLHKWEIVTRIVLDHSSWDLFRISKNVGSLRCAPKYKELMFVVATGKDLRSSDCLQFVPMESGQLIYSDKFQEIYLKPLDNTKFASWDKMQEQKDYGHLLSWEDMKTEFEISFLAAESKEDDEDVLFEEWKRRKMDDTNSSWPKITFVGVRKVDDQSSRWAQDLIHQIQDAG